MTIGLLIEIIVMVEVVLQKPAVRCKQAYPGLLHTGVLKVKDKNGLDLIVQRIDILARLALHTLARLALRDLASQSRQRTDWTKRDIGLLEKFPIDADSSCALFLDQPYQITDRRVLGIGIQLSERSFEVVAETGLNLVMKWGFRHDIEIYSSRFVIIFNPSDLQLVEFQQLSVQLLKKIVYVARLPVKGND